MVYDGNEDEYEDFYDYSELEAQQAELALVTSPEELAGGGGFELVLPGGSGSGGGQKVGGGLLTGQASWQLGLLQRLPGALLSAAVHRWC
jgi:hypothetical protein